MCRNLKTKPNALKNVPCTHNNFWIFEYRTCKLKKFPLHTTIFEFSNIESVNPLRLTAARWRKNFSHFLHLELCEILSFYDVTTILHNKLRNITKNNWNYKTNLTQSNALYEKFSCIVFERWCNVTCFYYMNCWTKLFKFKQAFNPYVIFFMFFFLINILILSK